MRRQIFIASLLLILLSGLVTWMFNFRRVSDFNSLFIWEAKGATEAVAQGPSQGPRPTDANQELNQRFEDHFRDINKRVDVLEAVKASLQSWITILIFTITILASANVGLSVWQVSSITRREVENSLKDYDVRFQEIIQRTHDDIENILSSYGRATQNIADLAKKVEDEIDKDKNILEATIRDIQNEGNGLLEKIKAEGTIIKNNLMNELDDYHRILVRKAGGEGYKK